MEVCLQSGLQRQQQLYAGLNRTLHVRLAHRMHREVSDEPSADVGWHSEELIWPGWLAQLNTAACQNRNYPEILNKLSVSSERRQEFKHAGYTQIKAIKHNCLLWLFRHLYPLG